MNSKGIGVVVSVGLADKAHQEGRASRKRSR